MRTLTLVQVDIHSWQNTAHIYHSAINTGLVVESLEAEFVKLCLYYP